MAKMIAVALLSMALPATGENTETRATEPTVQLCNGADSNWDAADAACERVGIFVRKP